MKCKNDKGFSLIELIIVIAIMAVLVAIIAPNLTKYLKKSKEQTNTKNLDEITNEVYTCISDSVISNVNIMDPSSTDDYAIYVLRYDKTHKKTKIVSNTNGTTAFAELLETVLDEARTEDRTDKSLESIEIKIQCDPSGGYDIYTRFVS